jgi:hypothetical protein
MNSESINNTYQKLGTTVDYDTKDFVILLLIVVLILSVLGINIFLIFGYVIQYIVYLLKPLLSIFGYMSGSIVNTTADLAADTTHFGIDIAEGTAHDVGNLLLATSDKNDIPTLPPSAKTYPMAIMNAIGKTLDIHQVSSQPNKTDTKPIEHVLKFSPSPSPSSSPSIMVHAPSADTTENPIQNPISNNKNNWCLIGEYQHRNGCIEIDDATKCMSGQLFPTQQLCLNPTLTTNIVPTNNSARQSGYYTENGILLPQINYYK